MTIPNSLKLRGPDSPVIVVAEDSPGDIYLIRRAIQTHVGYCDLVLVDDGEKAIQMIEEGEQSFECPAMLLLDWNLPRRSGREILGRLRSSDKYRQVPVIVLTSSDSPKDREDAEHLGATGHFRKPSDLDAFMRLGELIRGLLNEQAP